jgi:glycolate oxidase FAD binding subunit
MLSADSASCLLDDFGPLPVVRPATVAELGELVRGAAAEDRGIYPLGGRTMLEVGLPPAKLGTAVDLTALADVIDYPAHDMTITVRAGITIAELQRRLAAEGQRLPIDVPQSDRATLGGALAVNVSGPRRHGSGTLRDYVIGLSTVNDEGQETKAGGRVVKNVAGYDLCKLHIGALGTLGVITQVTLKVRPRPEAQALLTLGCAASELGSLLDVLHRSRTRPSCVDVLNGIAAREVATASGAALPAAAWIVVVGFEDNDDAVNWQVQRLMTEVASVRLQGVEARAGAAGTPLWSALVEQVGRPGRLAFTANLLPGATADFCSRAQQLAPTIALQAHAGVGIVRGFVDDVTEESARPLLRDLLSEAGAARGNLVLTRCPPAWKRTLPVWGTPRGDVALMRQVKAKFDPRGVFNPGRFVDGM